MVRRCNNPACGSEFKLLNTGALYALERKSADTEFFWLCSECAPLFDLCLDPHGKVEVKPRACRKPEQPPHGDPVLRLVAGPVHRIPWRWGIPANERATAPQFGFGPFCASGSGWDSRDFNRRPRD
jgi:hypothetical protein